MGSIFVTLNVIRGPRTPQERAASLAYLRSIDEELKKQGWTVVPANIASAACSTYKPPASESDALPGAGCAMESKGLAYRLGVIGSSVTVQQVKTLGDKMAARLPWVGGRTPVKHAYATLTLRGDIASSVEDAPPGTTAISLSQGIASVIANTRVPSAQICAGP